MIQYDFSKYFDSIKHEYIRFVLENSDFFISPAERHVIDAFLSHRFALIKDYKKENFSERVVGVPQGSSLSLFLSNIAAHELDKELEKSNGSFVRFADDIVCTVSNYEDAVSVTNAFREHCYYTGISINHKKSPGVCLLRNSKSKSERLYFLDHGDIGKIEHIDNFDYIGHKFSSDHIGMSSRGVERVKSRLSRIIYIHLLQNPRRGLVNPDRIGGKFYDWDLATCLNELRSYIYGGLAETKLRAFINENKRISRFKGLMSFYPLITCVDQLAMLDGWLISAIRRAHRERAKLFAKAGYPLKGLSEKEFIDGSWYQFDSVNLETRLPSFVLGWRAARKAFKQYGLADFESPDYYSLLSGDLPYD